MTTETNAERLESAKRLITAVREANSVDDPKKFWSSLLDLFGFGYLDLLLQQVERAQELEKDRNRLELRCGNLVEGIQLRDEENARLREAVEKVKEDLIPLLGVNSQHNNRITDICVDIKQTLNIQEDSK